MLLANASLNLREYKMHCNQTMVMHICHTDVEQQKHITKYYNLQIRSISKLSSSTLKVFTVMRILLTCNY